MVIKKVLVPFLLVLFLAVPFASHADTLTDIQSQMIALLQQIVELQKQLILSLTNQISQLQQQISELSQPVSTTISAPHVCAIVDPPSSCSTTLTVTRDSYNCVIAYQCAAAPITATTSPSASAPQLSCMPGAPFYTGSVMGICHGFPTSQQRTDKWVEMCESRTAAYGYKVTFAGCTATCRDWGVICNTNPSPQFL